MENERLRRWLSLAYCTDVFSHKVRDDAQNKGHAARQEIFDGLLQRLDNSAS